ncbi:hypothetical protein bcCo53_001364 (plasmid) [Borrelia coriaceae]|uniref:hypothetical protein n=1 Tax=Borrelia coriaceae TaxID=144 RepID=UPI0004B48DC6|nr:hypothetical protein [Borrelia coriaceae]UPA17188.1 hypothetical protein bcCo53_001364 [Borrelia coriaceae]
MYKVLQKITKMHSVGFSYGIQLACTGAAVEKIFSYFLNITIHVKLISSQVGVFITN